MRCNTYKIVYPNAPKAANRNDFCGPSTTVALLMLALSAGGGVRAALDRPLPIGGWTCAATLPPMPNRPLPSPPRPPSPPPPPVRASPWRRRVRRVAVALGVALTCLAMLCCAGVAYLAYDGHRA